MCYEIRVEFEWQVPKVRYRWIDESTVGDGGVVFIHRGDLVEADCRSPWLIGPAIEDQPPTETYHPLEKCPELHRTFAELPLEKEAILEFVQNYGQLTKGLLVVEEIGKEWSRIYRAESLYFWFGEIQHMRDAVRLLDILQQPDGASRLEKLIRGKEDGAHFYPFGEDERLVAQINRLEDFRQMAARRAVEPGSSEAFRKIDKRISQVRQEISQELKEIGRFCLGERLIAASDSLGARPDVRKERREVVGLARFLLAQTISEKLAGRIDLKVDGDESGFTVRIVPRDLLGALWLGLLFEIQGKVRIKRCPICGSWFDASRAPQRVYCDKRGSGCRQRASRLRKQLRALLGEGKTLGEAARELGVDLEQAKFLLKTSRR